MKNVRIITLLAGLAMLASCATNQQLATLDEYDDIYYRGNRGPELVASTGTEISPGYSKTGGSAESSYYQRKSYDVNRPAPAPKYQGAPVEKSQQTDEEYYEEDYYDAEYADEYNNFHSGGLGSSQWNNQPRMNMMFGYNSWNRSPMWGMGMGFGSPMWGSPHMMGGGFHSMCPPFGSPFYDPWCDPWGWNNPWMMRPRFGFHAHYGWGNPWHNPWYGGGMWGNPYWGGGMWGNPYWGGGMWGNPYSPFVGGNFPSDGGNGGTFRNSQRTSEGSRGQRGGVMNQNADGKSNDGRKSGEGQTGTVRASERGGTQSGSESAPAQRVRPSQQDASQAPSRNMAPADRVRPSQQQQQQQGMNRTRPVRSGEVISPYNRQQQMRTAPQGGNLNRGSAPSSQPQRMHRGSHGGAGGSYQSAPMQRSAPSSPSMSPSRGGGGGGGSFSPSSSPSRGGGRR